MAAPSKICVLALEKSTQNQKKAVHRRGALPLSLVLLLLFWGGVITFPLPPPPLLLLNPN